jgi:hypothetical protein
MPPSEEWMDKRINLFKSYCFPSIVNQTNQQFKWLIYIDNQTERKYVEILENFSIHLPNILSIIPANSWEELMEKNIINSDIAKLIDDDSDFLVTTRLDNDDAIHKYFIQTIQQEVLKFLESNNCKDNNKVAINLSKGYCLRVEPNYEFTSRMHFSNPFISLVEPLAKREQGFLTVLHLWHDHYVTQTDFPVIQINTIPYWIQVIHSTNVANELVGYPILDKTKLSDFGIDISKIHLSHSSYINFIIRNISHLYTRISTGITRRLKWMLTLD